MAPGGMRGGGRGAGRGFGRGGGRGMRRGRGFGRGMGPQRTPGPDPATSFGPGPSQPNGFTAPVRPQGPPPKETPVQGEVERLNQLARSIEQQKQEVERRIRRVESGQVPTPATAKPIVDAQSCTGCGICLDTCPVDAIVVVNDVATISDDCTACGACVAECPNNALAFEPAS